MLTREILLQEMARSEQKEEQTYKELTRQLFRELQTPLQGLYDEMASVTRQLADLSSEKLQQHPRIIKILRYCLAPVISQMRLGQLIEIDTTEPFEEQGLAPSDAQASRLVQWFTDYLDQDRFPWLGNNAMADPERSIAQHYAKLCTVSLVSNQNTSTKYRNQRKERQEQAIADALRQMGLTYQEHLGQPLPPRRRRKPGDPPGVATPRRRGGIDCVEDVMPDHYVREKKILAGSQKRQKSDLIARPSEVEMLYCIEAKAVGIRLDSTKRLKELNDKYTDWAKTTIPITTIGVCAGFFNAIELIATIQKRGIPIFFEHDLPQLTDFLRSRRYFGSPWEPGQQFPDVPLEEIQAGLQKIQVATSDGEVSG